MASIRALQNIVINFYIEELNKCFEEETNLEIALERAKKLKMEMRIKLTRGMITIPHYENWLKKYRKYEKFCNENPKI